MMIEAHGPSELVSDGWGESRIVSGDKRVRAGNIRQRNKAVKVLGQRTFEVGRNAVTRKRSPRKIILGGLGGEWIVNRKEGARSIDQAAEIAVPHGLSGNAVKVVCAAAQFITFVSEEEKCTVLTVVDFGYPNRSADAAAILVAVQRRHRV